MANQSASCESPSKPSWFSTLPEWHKEIIRERRRVAWGNRTKEAVAKKRESNRSFMRRYVAAKRDQLNARRRERARNASEEQKKRKRASVRAWYRKHPEQSNIWWHRRRGAVGSHTREEWLSVLGRHGHKCAECFRGDPEVRITKDHIIPISKGGSNFIQNIQPLCLSCNCRKGNRVGGHRDAGRERSV